MFQSLLVFWPSFIFGILHTIMPCEDKAIFIFYSFGVSRDSKHALKILSIYGSGLFSANMIIGTLVSAFSSIIGPYVQQTIDRFVWNAMSAASLIIAGFIMIVALQKNKYFPHKDQVKDITDGLPALKRRKRTAYALGLLAGLPPCIFELGIYSYAMGISLIYGWINGVVSIFFFGVGTFIGLFPLAIFGAMGGQFSKLIAKIQHAYRQQSGELPPEKENGENKKSILSKLELISASIMIFLGIVLLVYAILGIDIFPPESLNIFR